MFSVLAFEMNLELLKKSLSLHYQIVIFVVFFFLSFNTFKSLSIRLIYERIE